MRSAGQAIPSGDAFPNGEISPPTRAEILNCVAKFPLFSGEVALNREARVSRLTGKFDSTAREPNRQVNISVLMWKAARQGWDPGEKPYTPKRHSPLEWRFGTWIGHWPLGQTSVVLCHRFCCSNPAGFRFFGGVSCRVLRSFGWPDLFLAAWYITGTF